MSNFKMPTAYHPSNAEWVRPIESLTSDGVRELQRLKAENTKLREQNAKLHKLCADMMRFFEDDDWCDKCSLARECDSQEQYEDDCLMRLVFRDRMRKLGVDE